MTGIKFHRLLLNLASGKLLIISILLISNFVSAQIDRESFLFEEIIDGFHHFYDFKTGEYLSLEEMYDELINFDTVNRSHYHSSTLVNFKIINKGYDDPILITRYFEKAILKTDTSRIVLIELIHNSNGDYVKKDSIFVTNRFSSASMMDKSYFHQDSVIRFGEYKLISVKRENIDLTKLFCNRERYITFLPNQNFMQFYDNYSIQCQGVINEEEHHYRSSIISTAGKFHVSKGGYLYLISGDYGFLGRLKIVSNNDKRLVMVNDDGVLFEYQLRKK